jgi:hypothetical protein
MNIRNNKTHWPKSRMLESNDGSDLSNLPKRESQALLVAKLLHHPQLWPTKRAIRPKINGAWRHLGCKMTRIAHPHL